MEKFEQIIIEKYNEFDARSWINDWNFVYKWLKNEEHEILLCFIKIIFIIKQINNL